MNAFLPAGVPPRGLSPVRASPRRRKGTRFRYTTSYGSTGAFLAVAPLWHGLGARGRYSLALDGTKMRRKTILGVIRRY